MMPMKVTEILPVHEHDCEWCEYIATYPLRRPRKDRWNGGDIITHADIYRTCETGKSFYKFIVRYGITVSTPRRISRTSTCWLHGSTERMTTHESADATGCQQCDDVVRS